MLNVQTKKAELQKVNMLIAGIDDQIKYYSRQLRIAGYEQNKHFMAVYADCIRHYMIESEKAKNLQYAIREQLKSLYGYCN